MALLIPTTLRELTDAIIGVCTISIDHSRRPSYFSSYEDMWEELRQGFILLTPKLGARAEKLEEMRFQAKKHFEEGHAKGMQKQGHIFGHYLGRDDPGGEDITLGARLMQDMEEVVMNRSPFA